MSSPWHAVASAKAAMTRVHRRPNKERKIKYMKNRNTVFTAILVVVAFALAPVVEAGPRPDGGPINVFHRAQQCE